MFLRMIVGEKPRTVDEAELAGWDGLEAHCPVCRIISVLPWSLIRRRSGHRKLAEIKARLRCEHCRTRPDKVELTRRVNRGHGSTTTEKAPV